MSPNCVVERRLAIWLFVASASVMLVLHNGGLSGLDGETAYQIARSVVDHKRLDVGSGFNTTTGTGIICHWAGTAREATMETGAEAGEMPRTPRGRPRKCCT